MFYYVVKIKTLVIHTLLLNENYVINGRGVVVHNKYYYCVQGTD